MNEIIPHRVLWALLCPFAGLLRHRWPTVRVFIGEIPVPMVEQKGNDWLMESTTAPLFEAIPRVSESCREKLELCFSTSLK